MRSFLLLKKRLNEKLKIIETNNLVNQIEISKCIEIESTMLHSDRYRNAYLRITSNKFEFVKVDNNKYVFDLEQIYEKVSRYDFNLALEEIIGTIYQENLIEVMK